MNNQFSNFKSSDINYKIALWDPNHNGVRYLKTLLYNLAMNLSVESISKLSKIKNRNTGSPITVKCGQFEICIDYLQSLYELEFIDKTLQQERISNIKSNFKDNLSVLEIGAGYGRTCHTLLSNFSIEKYTIIEFKNYLLVKDYLKSVLDKDQFKKVNFIKFPDMPNEKFDLCINIDSFGEIDINEVKDFLKFIDKNCNYFYTKNMIGKYFDKKLDNHWRGESEVKQALKTGLMQKIIDIFDEKSIKKNKETFIKKYSPSKNWYCLSDSWAKPWSFYWQALYGKI